MNSPEVGGGAVIVCALKEEMKALRLGIGGRDGVVLRRAGVGPDSASRCADEIISENVAPRLLISTGFCGGLADGLKTGDLMLSHEILDAQSGRVIASDKARDIVAECSAHLKRAGIAHNVGRTVCTRDAVFSSSEKRALGEKFGAAAVDMESAALFAKFDAARTTCVVVRAVSDTVDDELPREVSEFLNEQGEVRVGKITRFVLKRPTRNITQLMQLKRNSDAAASVLTAAWRVLRTVIEEPRT